MYVATRMKQMTHHVVNIAVATPIFFHMVCGVFEVGPFNCKGMILPLAMLIGVALKVLAMLHLVHDFRN